MIYRNNNLNINTSILKFISMLLGLVAAYFLTIQSIKIDIASKADEKAVVIIDKKLTNIEVMLKQGVLSKEEFYLFSREMDSRLSRIEYLLADKTGESFEGLKKP